MIGYICTAFAMLALPLTIKNVREVSVQCKPLCESQPLHSHTPALLLIYLATTRQSFVLMRRRCCASYYNTSSTAGPQAAKESLLQDSSEAVDAKTVAGAGAVPNPLLVGNDRGVRLAFSSAAHASH
jgi:hypothetical protein